VRSPLVFWPAPAAKFSPNSSSPKDAWERNSYQKAIDSADLTLSHLAILPGLARFRIIFTDCPTIEAARAFFSTRFT
jgi:hypothetical protein